MFIFSCCVSRAVERKYENHERRKYEIRNAVSYFVPFVENEKYENYEKYEIYENNYSLRVRNFVFFVFYERNENETAFRLILMQKAVAIWTKKYEKYEKIRKIRNTKLKRNGFVAFS